MACDCNKTYSIGLGCCTPVLAPADNYYTKYQTEKKIEEAVSGLTGSTGCCITPEEVESAITSAMTIVEGEIPSLSGYATEQWVENQGYLTEHQHLKTLNGESLVGDGNIVISGGTDLSNYYTTAQTVNLVESAVTRVEGEMPSLSGYATEQWVLDKHYITGVDLSDYVTYESLPDLTVYATKTWVNNQNYVTNAELVQYISNLQNQIDSLKQQISGCCGDTGETLTRWITMTGANNYTCSGTTKYTKEKEQTSSDGGNTWTDTGNYRAGSTILETNSIDCGFEPGLKYTATYTDSSISTANCDGNNTIVIGEITKTNLQSIDVGDCVTAIESCVFCDIETLTDVNISSSLTAINDSTFLGCHHLTSVTFDSNSQLSTIGSRAFMGCNMVSVTLPSSLTTIGDEAFDENYNIQSITILAATPPILGYNPFTSTNNCPLLVPASSVNAYKAAWETIS